MVENNETKEEMKEEETVQDLDDESGGSIEIEIKDGEDESETDEAEGEDVSSDDGGTDEGALEEEAIDADEDEALGDDGKEEKKDPRIKSFFRKKSPKAKKEDPVAALTDKLKRQMAEFENFRKRSEKEKSQMYDMGAKSMIERILPVVDSFERGLQSLPEEEENPFADGMKMVYKQLSTALSEAGVEEIKAVGETFDPDLHNAVMHIDDDSYGENEVVEELQKGYKYHDTVVRYAMVKVAN